MSGQPHQYAPGYAYPTAPPPNGYYAYANQQYQPPTPDYQHHYEPHGQTYNYNPYAFAPPPQQQQQQSSYYPGPAPQQQQPVDSSPITTYTFERAEHKGWHVYDPMGSMIFDVTYKKAGLFKHDGCDVHHGEGGVKVATVYDETLTAGSFTSEIRRKTSHGEKMCFSDPHGGDFAFRETKTWDLLLVYPSKETIAQGNVNIKTGKGVLKIMDPMQTPDAPILVAAYVELLRKEQSDAEDQQAGVNGAIIGASFS